MGVIRDRGSFSGSVAVAVDVPLAAATDPGATAAVGDGTGPTETGPTGVGASASGAAGVGATVTGGSVIGATWTGGMSIGATETGGTVIGPTCTGGTVIGPTCTGGSVNVGVGNAGTVSAEREKGAACAYPGQNVKISRQQPSDSVATRNRTCTSAIVPARVKRQTMHSRAVRSSHAGSAE
jgi:hypothetical protein